DDPGSPPAGVSWLTTCACSPRPWRSSPSSNGWVITPKARQYQYSAWAKKTLLKPLIDVQRMATKGADMLHRALTAFVQEDVATAQIPAR
ncbi:MAG: hypothetical protein IPJ47_15330, partial [Anaerolineales bacterium]|nr:hypothetical protein [Anaerolineales bacterium]